MEESKTASRGFFSKNIALAAGGAVILAAVFGLIYYFAAFPAGYKMILVNAPSEADADSIATFTWRVDGPPASVKSTSVYFGTESNPGELGKEVKPEDTIYTDSIKDFISGDYKVPLQFVGNTQALANKEAKYYYRIYAQVSGKNYWSEEYTFTVKVPEYKTTLLISPKEAKAGDTVTFTWRVDGVATTIPSTTVYFGLESNPGTFGKNVKPSDTKYEDSIPDFIKGAYKIPLQFVGNAKMATAGVYFYRGYASIKGENYWTDEGTITITGKETVNP